MTNPSRLPSCLEPARLPYIQPFSHSARSLNMNNLHVRLNFDVGKANQIDHYSSKEHVNKISKIAKFGWQML